MSPSRIVAGAAALVIGIAVVFIRPFVDSRVIRHTGFLSHSQVIHGSTSTRIRALAQDVSERPSFSIEMRIYALRKSTYQDLFETARANDGLRLELDPSGQLGAVVRSPSQLGFVSCSFSRHLTFEKWHRVEIVLHTNGYLDGYLDGRKECQSQASQADPKFNHILLGIGYDASRPFVGEIRDVRIEYGVVRLRPAVAAATLVIIVSCAIIGLWLLAEPILVLGDRSVASLLRAFYRCSGSKAYRNVEDAVKRATLRAVDPWSDPDVRCAESASTSGTLGALSLTTMAAGVLILTALVFWDIPSAPLVGRDVSANLLSELARARNVSLYNVGASAMAAFARQHGGWFPLAGLELRLWPYIALSGLPQLIQFASIVTNFASFALVVAVVARSTAYGWLATCTTLLCFQYRKPLDPIIASAFRWPLTTELLLLAVLAWVFAERSRGTRSLLAAVAFIACFVALTLYSPVALPLIFATSIMAMRAKSTVGRAAAAIATLVVLAAALISVRYYAVHARDAIGSSWSQVVAGVPTIYRAGGNLFKDGLLPGVRDVQFAAVPQPFLAWPAAAATAICLTWAIYVVAAKSRHSNAVGLLGITLWIAGSAFGIVFSGSAPRAIGQATSGVYLENFGIGAVLAFALAAASVRLQKARSSWLTALVATLSLLVLDIEYGNQRIGAYVISLDRQSVIAYDRLGEASRSGLFSKLPTATRLEFSPAYGFSRDATAYDSGRSFLEATSRRASSSNMLASDACVRSRENCVLRIAPIVGRANSSGPSISIDQGSKRYAVFVFATARDRNRRFYELTSNQCDNSKQFERIGETAILLRYGSLRKPAANRIKAQSGIES